MRLIFGPSVNDSARAHNYRPERFSKPFYELMQEVLCGPSEWSLEERELFAALVASCMNCRFCTAARTEWANAKVRSPYWVEKILSGKQGGSVDPKLLMILSFLEKLTQPPWNVKVVDIDCLRENGISDVAVQEAAMVCVVFSIGSRVAQLLDLKVLSPSAIRRFTPFILATGYKMFTI